MTATADLDLGRGAEAGRRTRWPSARIYTVLLLAVLLVEAAWILVVPAFRGLDEHDHAYRADAVAHGEVLPDYVVGPSGRGELLTVRASIVAAAGPECRDLPYTTDDVCAPVEVLGDGRVTVGSSAARYNPVFYALTGTAALPFDGMAALYAMRSAGALASGLVLAWALTLVWRHGGPWQRSTALLALTPMATYSSSIASPNGLEMAAGTLLWAALLAARGTLEAGRRLPTHLVVAVGLAGSLLGNLRTLGPMWLVLIAATYAVMLPPGRLRESVRETRRGLALAGTAIAVSTGAGVAWTLVSGANRPSLEGLHLTASPFPTAFFQPLVWLLQSVGAFPARNELAPMGVFVLILPIWAVLLLAGWRAAGHRDGRCLGGVLALSLVVPATLSMLTFHQLGWAWQGRYTWPLAVGVPLLVGHLLDRAHPHPALERLPVVAAGAVMAIATAWCVIAVLSDQARTSPLASSGAWNPPTAYLVGALAVCGFGLALAVLQRSREPQARGRA